MNHAWFEDLIALAAAGNFSRAAEARHSSQPAFSRRIRALEDWVGTPLVDRSTLPVTLTDAGEFVRAQAEDLVVRTARLPAEARQVAQASAATLRIACTHALSFTFLPRWLRGLESRIELGPVELVSDVLARCEAQMRQGTVHFVLTHAHPAVRGPLDSDAHLSAVVGTDRLVPVSRPAAARRPLHRLGSRGAVPVPLLAYSDASGLGRIVRGALGARLDALPARPVFTAHLASVLRSMAIDGRGLAWLPASLVDDDLAAGRLVEAGDASWRADLEVRLYRPRGPIGRPAQAVWAAATAAG